MNMVQTVRWVRSWARSGPQSHCPVTCQGPCTGPASLTWEDTPCTYGRQITSATTGAFFHHVPYSVGAVLSANGLGTCCKGISCHSMCSMGLPSRLLQQKAAYLAQAFRGAATSRSTFWLVTHRVSVIQADMHCYMPCCPCCRLVSAWGSRRVTCLSQHPMCATHTCWR